METRKIWAMGKYSLVVTLPKKWLETNNLDRGDNVSLSIQPDLSLVIYPSLKKSEQKKEITLVINTNENTDSIIRKIISCYLNGYTVVKLESMDIFSVEQQTAIRSVVRSLYFRIIESTAKKAVLQTLMDESMASVVSGIERMHIITSSMCHDVLNAMKNWNTDLAMSVVSLEDDVDQYMFFLLRLIRMASMDPSLANLLDLNMIDCLDCQTLVHRIEQVADHTTDIANGVIALTDRKLGIPEKIFSILVNAAEIAFTSYDMAVESFLSKNVDHTNEIIEGQNRIETLGELITPLPYFGERQQQVIVCPLCTMRDSIKRISEYAADIAELTIDRSFVMHDGP